MLIHQLPDDVLYHVLSFLDCRSLGRLSQVCKAIHQFTIRDQVWRRIARHLINTGITRHGTDLCPHIPLRERVRVSRNWHRGVCVKQALLKWKTNLLPWIQLNGDVLYLSQAADIRAYHLPQGRGKLQRSPLAVFSGHRDDVCRFVVTDTHLVSGGGEGKIMVHHRSGVSVEYLGHNQEVNCLDCRGGLIVSGSRDKTARIWTLSSNSPHYTIPLYDRVWSVAISPTLSSFVTGTACCENQAPLKIWDVERCECVCVLGVEWRRGAGVLDVVYQTPRLLLSCGYDTFIRAWDLRLSPRKCVMEWEEPHDSALYCVQTDGSHMMASGSAYYGVVRLWDKRQTHCLQTFQLTSAASSPVYCLRFSSSHLYATVATALHALDFTHGPPPAR